MTRPKQLVSMCREKLETPDGDELVLDHLNGTQRGGAPRVVLMHGLEGSSYSVYMQGIMALAAARGWGATAINFRSCARDPGEITRMLPNRRPRMYHSGETTDFDFVVKTLAARHPDAPLLAFGVSLGGNAMLKWLGENPAQKMVRAAAMISVPYDLARGSRFMENPIGRYYLANFLQTLRPKVIRAVRTFPELASRIDVKRVRLSQTFYEYDDCATAPMHGFAGVDDYYSRSSSLGYVGRVATPALCISSEDDPFLPREVLLEAKAAASRSVEFIFTRQGGHVGFVSGPGPWKQTYWAEELVVEWLAKKMEEVAI